MLKFQKYKIDITPRMIDLISEICETLGRFSQCGLQDYTDKQNLKILFEKLTNDMVYRSDNGPIVKEKAIELHYKMLDWKVSSFDDFFEASVFLVGNSKLKIKQVDVSRKVSYGGFSRLANMINSRSDLRSFFQAVESSEYHPLILCGFFNWITLKYPIYDDCDINSLTTGFWQNIILAQWRPIFYHVFAIEYFWMKKVISSYMSSKARFSDDLGVFIEHNLDALLHILQETIRSQDFLLTNKIVKSQNVQDETEQVNETRQDDKCDELSQESIEAQVFIDQMIGKKELSEKLKQLVSCMDLSQKYSASALRDLLKLTSRPNFSQNYLHPALDLEVIKMTIPDKPRSRNQEYFLNPKNFDC